MNILQLIKSLTGKQTTTSYIKDTLSNPHYEYVLNKYNELISKDSDNNIYNIFSDLYDDDLWNILLTREYKNYANIKKLLPELPAADLQKAWTGNSGMNLSIQSNAFYKKAKYSYSSIADKPLKNTKILDFGCGWGRLIRYFAKDVPESNLFGCDPDDKILDICRQTRVPGILRKSDYRPEKLPFDNHFDLIYAYSVFTHLSEKTHLECLEVLHQFLEPHGILIVTVRPRTFLKVKGIDLSKLTDTTIKEMLEQYDNSNYIYNPYNMPPVNGEITYGDTVIPYSYIMKHWTKMFDVIGPIIFVEDNYQIPLILRKK